MHGRMAMTRRQLIAALVGIEVVLVLILVWNYVNG